jgi:hypothetical protein
MNRVTLFPVSGPKWTQADLLAVFLSASQVLVSVSDAMSQFALLLPSIFKECFLGHITTLDVCARPVQGHFEANTKPFLITWLGLC